MAGSIDLVPAGTKAEQKQCIEVRRHYDMSRNDLDKRIEEFDDVDELMRSHINESNWPYRSQIFDPIVFRTLYEKNSRLIASKPRGRMGMLYRLK
jgi:hypothetical protein